MCLKLNMMHSKKTEVVLGPTELRFIYGKKIRATKQVFCFCF